MAFTLRVKGDEGVAGEILADLEDCRLRFNGGKDAPQVTLTFEKKGEAVSVDYRVETDMRVLQTGNLTVSPDEMNDAGRLLAYRLFGIHKSTIGEKLPAEKVVPEQPKKPEPKQAA